MKKILMIAYEFPPLNFSGTARPFGFARYLSEFDYYPTVLTRSGTGKQSSDEEMLGALKKRCDIVRVKTGDNDDRAGWLQQRIGFMDRPFRWLGMGNHRFTESVAWRAGILLPGFSEHIHWTWPALKTGLKLLKQKHFDLIWATGDPWSSLIAGYALSRFSGLPFIADIRDPWTYGVMWNPSTPREADWLRKWERKILSHAERTIFTSPLTCDVYRKKVSVGHASSLTAITNGFDDFTASNNQKRSDEKCLFCFVGNLTAHRDPRVLVEGMQLASKSIETDRIELQFIGDMRRYQTVVDNHLVRHIPSVPQNQSRQYMRQADVLLLLQANMKDGSDVISGKAYEYLAAGRPILGVVPEDGGDAWLIRETNAGLVTGATDPKKIAEGILHFWRLWKEKKLVSQVQPETIARFHRRNLTRQLAELFDDVLRERGARE